MPGIEVGRICIKTAGRDAGKRCVIVEILDRNYVVSTGFKEWNNVRRRRVNIKHLYPLEEKISIPPRASNEEVEKAFLQFQGDNKA